MGFTDVVGQELPIKLLQNAIDNERISHAYLFTGKEGVGKEFVAFQFAKAINCKELELDACDECISCRKFNNGNHPDIIKISPDGSSIKIDQIRNLQQQISYKPYESEWKIYIIEEAEKMNLQAANSLLRTLEEPPSYAIIILLAPKEELLLPTITSRCQIVKFRSLTVDEITDKLISEFKLKTQEARKRAVLADGSLDKAITLSKDESFLLRRSQILDKIKDLLNLDLVEVFELVKEILDYKDEINNILKDIEMFYRDLILYKGSKNTDLIVNFDYEEDIIELSKEYTFTELQSVIEYVEEISNLIKNTNVKLQLALEVMLLKIKEKRV
ncbi:MULTISPECIES: DNA polymerase III subunit delta' [unclassified Candidatus Frackibacter]|uniref:DNA polymerase III subunit delta' n=1 Tax=unclassified Candidatus Frackibacter TaxID=2648818 RepID=UPI00088F23F4|nr:MULTISPECIES: DNA polymerase III subunit delta' [unclassified Candidatus Frackibacter]SDC54429.1 DNA polymerase III, delta prime subunit [Candidatus Frackibacter sp. WG11]SEM66626.1 DNA polymerase III, delta prime subunit [Candidatus Frackibacter sp. WG12]SFL77939.1 DNA polymerase III, delta prime subunit [Candidatus Frackibacter sp. WG13]